MPVAKKTISHKIRNLKLRRGEQDYLLQAVKRQKAAGLPVMLDIQDLAAHTGELPKNIAAMVNAPSHFYRQFSIPKRSGGTREILAPFPSLATLQSWIVNSIVNFAPVHSAAIAYRKNTSIKDHVQRHFKQSELFRTDIRDFFPSISVFTVKNLFVSLGYADTMAWMLAQLVTLNGSLPQGAPSSPALSNAICQPLDDSIAKICERNDVTYSRYADDFAFSGNSITTAFVEEIRTEFELYGFALNVNKTRHYGVHEEVRFLTGLVITPNRIRPPKHFRRWVRQKIFYLEKFLVSDLEAPGPAKGKSELLENAFLLDSTRGKIGYWLWVDPQDAEGLEQLRRLNAIYLKLYE